MSETSPFSVSSCPHCHGEVRIADSLLGQPVKCPRCDGFFRLSSPAQPPEKLEVAPPRKTSPTLLVGLILLLVGLTGFFCDGAFVVLTMTMQDRIVDGVLNQAKNPDTLLKRWLDIPAEFDEDEFRARVRDRLEAARKLHFSFAGVSLVITLGGIGALRRRWYRLAMVSCFLSMLNLGFFCCLMGLPAGVYGLIRLLDPEVRAQFSVKIG